MRDLLKDQNVQLRYEPGRHIYIEPAGVSDNEVGQMIPVQGVVRGEDVDDVLIGATVIITDGSGNSTGMGV